MILVPKTTATSHPSLPEGTRLRIDHYEDPDIYVAPGTCGVVHYCDWFGNALIELDTGIQISINAIIDKFELITNKNRR